MFDWNVWKNEKTNALSSSPMDRYSPCLRSLFVFARVLESAFCSAVSTGSDNDNINARTVLTRNMVCEKRNITIPRINKPTSMATTVIREMLDQLNATRWKSVQ